jgi:hypothetical protein
LKSIGLPKRKSHPKVAVDRIAGGMMAPWPLLTYICRQELSRIMKNAMQNAARLFGYSIHKTNTAQRLECEIRDSAKQLDTLRTENDELLAENGSLVAETQRLERKISESSRQSDDLRSENDALRTIAKRLEGEKRDSEKQYYVLRSEIDSLLREREDLQQRLQVLESRRKYNSPIMEAYENLPLSGSVHASGSFPTHVLKRVEEILPSKIENSAETGCGKSTILFSNIANRHKVFSLDDSSLEDSSVQFFRDCPLTKNDRVETVFGPTQQTLPIYRTHEKYDVVLIDGPHGYPFPELEYLALYPHIKEGGYLIVDDVSIPTIARLADFIAEDEMFELVETISATSIFRRTSAPTFNPSGDGWWTQRYNRRRVSPKRDIFLGDGEVADEITAQKIDHKINATT